MVGYIFYCDIWRIDSPIHVPVQCMYTESTWSLISLAIPYLYLHFVLSDPNILYPKVLAYSIDTESYTHLHWLRAMCSPAVGTELKVLSVEFRSIDAFPALASPNNSNFSRWSRWGETIFWLGERKTDKPDVPKRETGPNANHFRMWVDTGAYKLLVDIIKNISSCLKRALNPALLH